LHAGRYPEGAREYAREWVGMTDILERAFMARIRADEYREALAALQQEFDERPDVIEIKRRIERCEEERGRRSRRRRSRASQAGLVPAQGPHPQAAHGDPGAVLRPIRRGGVRPVLHCRHR